MTADAFYPRYLKGKDVAIIGGDDRDHAIPIARNAEVVVRINAHFLRQGGRVDVLYHSGMGMETQMIESGRLETLKFLWLDLSPGHESARGRGQLCRFCADRMITVGRYNLRVYEHKNPVGPELEWCNELGKLLCTTPLTGVMAIHHLLRQPIKSLLVCGFSFYDGIKEIGPHYLPAQRLWLKRLKDIEPRLRITPYVEKWLFDGSS